MQTLRERVLDQSHFLNIQSRKCVFYEMVLMYIYFMIKQTEKNEACVHSFIRIFQ